MKPGSFHCKNERLSTEVYPDYGYDCFCLAQPHTIKCALTHPTCRQIWTAVDQDLHTAAQKALESAKDLDRPTVTTLRTNRKPRLRPLHSRSERFR
jgi:hypothetical protein